MQWDKDAQLRHSAICLWPKLLVGGRSEEILRIQDQLQLLGYDGCVESLPANSILEGWRKEGWVEVSPDRTQIRLMADGEEALARWQEEDRLWRSGVKGELELPKRLKAGEPATNLRRIAQVIAGREIQCVHDPYTRAMSVQTLLKLSELGTSIHSGLRILSSPLSRIDGQTLASFLGDLNIERGSHWEARTYTTPERPHRRFLVCTDGTIITCGLSLNNVNKDEVLEVIPANDKHAEHDLQFFEEKWKQGSVVH